MVHLLPRINLHWQGIPQFTFRVHYWCHAFHRLGEIYPWVYPALYHHVQIPALKTCCARPIHLSPLPLTTTNLLTIPIVLPFLQHSIDGKIHFRAFSNWLLSLSNMHLRCLQGFWSLDSSFRLSDRILHCLDVSQLRYPSPTEGLLSCFQVLAIIKLLQTSMCKFLGGHKFSTPLGKYQGAWC